MGSRVGVGTELPEALEGTVVGAFEGGLPAVELNKGLRVFGIADERQGQGVYGGIGGMGGRSLALELLSAFFAEDDPADEGEGFDAAVTVEGVVGDDASFHGG